MLSWQVEKSSLQISLDFCHQNFQVSNRIPNQISPKKSQTHFCRLGSPRNGVEHFQNGLNLSGRYSREWSECVQHSPVLAKWIREWTKRIFRILQRNKKSEWRGNQWAICPWTEKSEWWPPRFKQVKISTSDCFKLVWPHQGWSNFRCREPEELSVTEGSQSERLNEGLSECTKTKGIEKASFRESILSSASLKFASKKPWETLG